MTEWRFLFDENIDPKTATYLDKEGIHAEHVRDALRKGADDDEILGYARENDLVVVTRDVSDFSDRPPTDHAGIVLLYDETMPAYRVASAIFAMIDTYPGREEFAGREELDSWA